MVLKLFRIRVGDHKNSGYFSFWGDYNELYEVIELAKQGKISHSIQEFPLSEINKVADMLRNGEIKGRAVIVPK